MASKTISLSLDSYNRLKAARKHPGESFSSVIRRARWDDALPLGDGNEILRYYNAFSPTSKPHGERAASNGLSADEVLRSFQQVALPWLGIPAQAQRRLAGFGVVETLDDGRIGRRRGFGGGGRGVKEKG